MSDEPKREWAPTLPDHMLAAIRAADPDWYAAYLRIQSEQRYASAHE